MVITILFMEKHLDIHTSNKCSNTSLFFSKFRDMAVLKLCVVLFLLVKEFVQGSAAIYFYRQAVSIIAFLF